VKASSGILPSSTPTGIRQFLTEETKKKREKKTDQQTTNIFLPGKKIQAEHQEQILLLVVMKYEKSKKKKTTTPLFFSHQSLIKDKIRTTAMNMIKQRMLALDGNVGSLVVRSPCSIRIYILWTALFLTEEETAVSKRLRIFPHFLFQAQRH